MAFKFQVSIECALCGKVLDSKPHTCSNGVTYAGIIGLDLYEKIDQLDKKFKDQVETNNLLTQTISDLHSDKKDMQETIDRFERERDEAVADANLSRGNLINADKKIENLGKIISSYQNNTDVAIRDKKIELLETMLKINRRTFASAGIPNTMPEYVELYNINTRLRATLDWILNDNPCGINCSKKGKLQPCCESRIVKLMGG